MADARDARYHSAIGPGILTEMQAELPGKSHRKGPSRLTVGSSEHPIQSGVGEGCPSCPACRIPVGERSRIGLCTHPILRGEDQECVFRAKARFEVTLLVLARRATRSRRSGLFMSVAVAHRDSKRDQSPTHCARVHAEHSTDGG
jgi:hypothetical protein